ncbi:MAG: lytic transglycosylase domain-containing protein, partial [Pseudomonadota bacterium]|nr:lytic transglycosylase domain-containing protein [Pseudomonadota bacterium]
MGASMGQDQLGWGRATQMLAGDPGANASLASTIVEWKSLTQSNNLPFESYARFLIAHPGWPSELALRRSAERAIPAGGWSPTIAVAFFRRYPPLTNTARAAFAQALQATGARDEAMLAATSAWRAGALSATDETAILTGFGGSLTPADQDARMDALLWQG